MFEALGLGHLLDSLEPMPVYRIAVGDAFANDTKGPHVEALRRAYLALCDAKLYRTTPEFDKLLAF